MAIELATAYVSLIAATPGLGKDVVAEFGGAGDKASKSFGSKFGAGVKSLIGPLAGIGAAIGLKNFVGQAVAASDATDKFKQTLQFAGLKGDKIAALTKSTQAYADKTVFSLADIQGVTAQLAANGVKGYDTLAQAAGNLNAVAGGNAETFKSVGMVLTQTAGAGKLTTENWNQLANAIPGASGQLQDALKKAGAYTGNFRDAMQKGQISADEFNAAIQKIGMTDVAKKAATSTKTIEGSWGNLQATITGTLAAIVTQIKPGITALFNGLSNGIQTATVWAQAVVQWIQKWQGVLIPAGAALGVLAVGLAAVAIQQQIMEAGGFIKFISNVVKSTKLWAAGQWLLDAALNANPIGLVIIAIAALVAGIVLAWKHSETFRNVVLAVWAAIKTAVFAVVGWFKSAVIPFFTKTLPNAFGIVVSWVKGHWPLLLSILTGPIGAAVIFIIRHWDQIKAVTASVWNAVKSTIQSAWAAIVGGIKSKITAAVDAVSGIKSKITSTLAGMGQALRDAGAALIQKLVDGVLDRIQAVKDAAGRIANIIKGFFGGSPVEEGPLLGWNGGKVGKNLVQMGLIDGLNGSRSALAAASSGLAGSVRVPALSGAVGGPGGVGAPLVNVFVQATPDGPYIKAQARIALDEDLVRSAGAAGLVGVGV